MKSLVLWPTSRCNLRCGYCYAAEVKEADMDMATVKAALRQMEDGPFHVQIAGGEPLCNKEMVVKILEAASGHPGCRRISIQTNATLIDDDIAQRFKACSAAVGVSLDGQPKINELQRGKTAEAVCGIQTLAKHGLCANLTCVVTAANVNHLTGLADFAAYLGNIRGIGLDLLRRAGRARACGGEGIQRADPEELKKALDGLCDRLDMWNKTLPPGRRIALRELEKARRQLLRPSSQKEYCYASRGKSVVVLPDGSCYPCASLVYRQEYAMGNVHHIIQPVSIRAGIPEECSGCSYQKACTGGCPSRGLLLYNGPAPDNRDGRSFPENGKEDEKLTGGFDPLDCVMKKYMFNKQTRRK